jgi:glycosyltransferase involved in cell wall biosynthesis
MKVAFIGQKGIPATGGGVERYVEAVASKLVKLNHKVFVYTRPYYTPATKKTYLGVKLVSLPSIHTKNLDAISNVFFATIHALFQDYDIIHYQGVGPSLLSFIPRIFKPSTKVVVTFHSLDRLHAKWSKLAKLILTISEWTACKFPHQTIAVSRGLQAYCLKRYNTPTTFIPNGIYIDSKSNDPNVLKEFGLQKDKYFIVMSRLVSHKRIEDVINAFMKINKPDFKLVVLGSSSYTEDYQNFLHELAANDERIIFIESLKRERLFTVMRNAIALASASEDEGMPITILEAISLGLPVILSDISGHRELGDDLTYFNLYDIAQLKKEMQYVLKNTKKVKAAAKLQQKIIINDYNWDDIAKSISDIYRQDIVAPQSLGNTLF